MFKNFTDDIRVVDIKITSAAGESKTIISQVVNLQIQEDVTSPYVFAEITLNDAIGLLQGLPIKGEETIELEFETPVLADAALKYKFLVYAVSHLSSGIKNDMNIYQLKCVSEELMINASKFVSKGYKDTFSAIVEDIVKMELGSSKPIDVGATLGVQEWVIPSQKPFQAIDMIRRRATSTAHGHSPMLFFETQDGYVFNDMASLYQRGVDQDIGTITYNFTNATVLESTRNGVITAFNAPEKRDTFEQVNNGAFNNKVTTYDIVTKTLKTYDFNYQDKQSTFNFFNNKSTHSDAFISKFSASPSRTYLIPIDSTKPDHFVDRMGDKQAYTSVMFQNLIRARLVGGKNNQLLRAGGVVFLSFPAEMASYNNPNGKNERDTQNSGFYFLKRVVHELSLATSPITYSASCELVAGAPMEKLKL
jgi:hypothetical protein